jgi:ubiquinone/menaquinone biosynthesis C-methylase UbiE
MACNRPQGDGHTPTDGPLNDSLTAADSLRTVLSRFVDPQRDLWQRPAWVIGQLGPLRGKTVADIGAGAGYFALPMASLSGHVIAIDVDTGWVEYLRQQQELQNLTNLEIRLTTPDNPNLRPQEVDVVLVANTYTFIERRKQYFRKLRPALKPEGKLWVLDFLPGNLPVGPGDSFKLSPLRVMDELRQAGFRTFVLDTTSLQYQYLLSAQ